MEVRKARAVRSVSGNSPTYDYTAKCFHYLLFPNLIGFSFCNYYFIYMYPKFRFETHKQLNFQYDVFSNFFYSNIQNYSKDMTTVTIYIYSSVFCSNSKQILNWIKFIYIIIRFELSVF